MANGFNQVTLIGNLGRDPELRQTKAGNPVTTIGLAVNDRAKDANGNWTDVTHWIDCVFFGKAAETIAQHCGKGSRLHVGGKLTTREFQDQSGAKRKVYEVRGDSFVFLDAKGEQSPKQAPQPAPQPEGFPEDDIPF